MQPVRLRVQLALHEQREQRLDERLAERRRARAGCAVRYGQVANEFTRRQRLDHVLQEEPDEEDAVARLPHGIPGGLGLGGEVQQVNGPPDERLEVAARRIVAHHLSAEGVGCSRELLC